MDNQGERVIIMSSHRISELGIRGLTASESSMLRKLLARVKSLHRKGKLMLVILPTKGLLTQMLLQAIYQVIHARLKRSSLGGQVEAPRSVDLGKHCDSTKKRQWGGLTFKRLHKLRAAVTWSFFFSHHQRRNSNHAIISERMLDLQTQTSKMRLPSPRV